MPVLVGSLGRIPVGALTDRLGGRVMFPAVSFLTILPVLFLGLLGQDSFAALLVGGFFLGIGGTAFAVGVPLVNAWFPPERRGFAIGVFGAGMGGTAISALTTVRLVDAGSDATPFLLTAGCPRRVRRARRAAAARRPRPVPPDHVGAAPPGRRGAPAHHARGRAAVRRRLRRLRRLQRLPADLPARGYGLEQNDAAQRMAGFVVLAVLMRPAGGWLSDRVAPLKVLAGAFAVVCVCAAVQSATPDLMPVGTIAFLTMAACLGAASGAVFAHVAQRAPQARSAR